MNILATYTDDMMICHKQVAFEKEEPKPLGDKLLRAEAN